MNYYEILGININATQKEVKDAFRKEARRWHPDLNKSEEAHSRMQLINEAYETLSDLNKRKEYDKRIAKGTVSVAYATYTKSRQESESDLDDWLKEYLKQRRKIDEVYKEYAEILSRIKWLEDRFYSVDKKDLIAKEKLEMEIRKWHFQKCNNDKGSVSVLEYLFSKIELYSKDAFDENTGYYIIPAKEDKKYLYEIYKLEFLNVIKSFSKKDTTVKFLSLKVRKYAFNFGYDYSYAIPDNLKDILNFLITNLNNVLKKVDDDAISIFDSLFEQLELCFFGYDIVNYQSAKAQKNAILTLSKIIEIYLSSIIDTKYRDEILRYLIKKAVDNGENQHSYYAGEMSIMEFINKYINILVRKNRKK